MIRGTTPTHIFQLPFNTDVCAKLKVIYAQDENILLEKDVNQCSLSGNTVSVTLTQDETFKFDCKKPVQIQMRVLTTGGEALASAIRLVSVEKCLDSEVLT